VSARQQSLGRSVWQQDGVRDATVVVDHHVQVLPSGMRVAVSYLDAERTFARSPETPEPFDVQVNQLARGRVLIPMDVGTRLCRATRKAGAPQDPPDRRGRTAQYRREPHGAPARLRAQLDDLLFRLDR
jgi:hypothetical protein